MSNILHPDIHFEYAGLFVGKENWIHPDRIEKTHEIIYVTAGEVYLNDGGKDVCIKKGELIVLPMGVRHYGTKTSDGVSFYWLHFQTSDGSLPCPCRFLERFDSPHLFKELLHFAFLPMRNEAMVNAILLRILAEIDYLSATFIPSGDKQSKTAAEIYEYLRMSASARTTVEKTAAHFGFSPDHVTRLIKKQYGVGAKTLINAFLLARAKELLSGSGKYVKEIAYELEFSSDKAFIGFFKYHEGMFPGEFREKFYQIHMNDH